MANWAEYRKTQYSDKRVNLIEIGLPDTYVNLRNIAGYTPLEMRKSLADFEKKFNGYIDTISAKTEEVQRQYEESESMTEDELYDALMSPELSIPTIMSAFHQWMITDWNITDENGATLTLPSEDPTTLFYIPVGVQHYLVGLIDAYVEDANKTPKVKLTP